MDRSLLVYIAQRDVVCTACSEVVRRGNLHMNRARHAHCLACAGLDHLVFIIPGDAALTRRSTRGSMTSAIVLKQNRRRRRFDRAGTLVEPDALRQARSARWRV
jgi:hypothetical protein